MPPVQCLEGTQVGMLVQYAVFLLSCRFRALKEQRLKEMQLENGLSVREEDRLEADAALEIKGSDPSKWEDGSFEERVRAVEEHKLLMENNRVNHVDPLDTSANLLYKRHERASSQSGMDTEEEVIVRERPKSLEDLNQKKVVRAKRESRRMRELEQAKFSLELLKVRSTGGLSPSEERRWSTEIVSEALHSPQGTPESESSQGSFEMLSCEDTPSNKLVSLVLDEQDAQSFSTDSLPSSPQAHLQEKSFCAADVNSNLPSCRRIPSDLELLDNLTMKEHVVCDPQNVICKAHPRETFLSSNLPTFYVPPEDNVKVKLMENNLRNKAVEREERTVTFSEPDQGRAVGGEEEKSSSKREERGTVIATQAHSPDSVIQRLEKLNVEKEERQKQLQLQNEKEMMEQIRQQKEILERQRKAFEQQGRVEALQRAEQSRMKDPSLKPTKKPDNRPQSVLILHPQSRGEHCPTTGVTQTSSVDIKGLTVGTRGSSPAHSAPKDRPVSMFMERRDGQSGSALEPRCHSRPALDPRDLPGSHFSRTERLRQPRMPNQATEETRASTMFFTPKDNPFGLQ